jgi:hypothetical protein
MRKGIDGVAMLVQGVLRQDPFSGHLFLFRGRTASGSALVKPGHIGLRTSCPLYLRYCCKSRKSNDSENLAKVDF